MEWPFVGREREFSDLKASLDSGRGAVLTGPAGVGKSRMLREVIDALVRDGHRAIRTVATQATARVPFAPFVGILPGQVTEDITDLFRLGIGRLSAMRTASGLVVGVDDVHYLDDGSLALLTNIVSSGVATVVTTISDDIDRSPEFASVVQSEDLARMELGPLSETATRDLITAVLGDTSTTLRDELWRLSGGNPLMIHELVEGAVGKSIVSEGSGWALRGSLIDTPRLRALVERRLQGLTETERDALEVVALGAPLATSIADAVVDQDSMRALERDGVVTVLDDPVSGRVVTPTHPLYGEVLASHAGTLSRRRIYGRLLAAVVEADGPTQIDPVRVALWDRERGERLNVDLAVSGAAVALSRHDARLAEELAGAVADQSTAASVVLGRSLSFQGRYQEAEDLLQHLAPDDRILGDWASARAHNLAFGLGRVEDAVELLAETSGRVGDPAVQGRLDAERGIVSALPGDFDEALAASNAVLGNPDAPDMARATAYVSLTLAQAMTADTEGLASVIDDALIVARRNASALPLAEDQMIIMQVHALLVSGRVNEGLELTRRRSERAGDDNVMSSTWLCQLGQCLEQNGRLSEALDSQRKARALLGRFDPFRLEMQAQGCFALTAGQMGRVLPAAELTQLEREVAEPRISLYLGRGKAWQLAAQGRLREGAEEAARAGRASLEGQHMALGSRGLHDAVRMGFPELSIEGLERAVEASTGARLIEVFLDHARALTGRDAVALSDAAMRLGAFGATLLAAEAAARASALHHEAYEVVDATRAAAHSMRWESQCQSPGTPALAERPALISPRELQMAIAAAGGAASAEIAERHYVSVRTVDNHLGSVYRKLGLGGRDELALFWNSHHAGS